MRHPALTVTTPDYGSLVHQPAIHLKAEILHFHRRMKVHSANPDPVFLRPVDQEGISVSDAISTWRCASHITMSAGKYAGTIFRAFFFCNHNPPLCFCC